MARVWVSKAALGLAAQQSLPLWLVPRPAALHATAGIQRCHSDHATSSVPLRAKQKDCCRPRAPGEGACGNGVLPACLPCRPLCEVQFIQWSLERYASGARYSQRKRENLGDMITETLHLLERCGGEDACLGAQLATFKCGRPASCLRRAMDRSSKPYVGQGCSFEHLESLPIQIREGQRGSLTSST